MYAPGLVAHFAKLRVCFHPRAPQFGKMRYASIASQRILVARELARSPCWMLWRSHAVSHLRALPRLALRLPAADSAGCTCSGETLGPVR